MTNWRTAPAGSLIGLSFASSGRRSLLSGGRLCHQLGCVSSGAQPAPHIAWLDGTAVMLPLAFLIPLVRRPRRDAGRQTRNLQLSGTMAADNRPRIATKEVKVEDKF
jgi:hypothetical protein